MNAWKRGRYAYVHLWAQRPHFTIVRTTGNEGSALMESKTYWTRITFGGLRDTTSSEGSLGKKPVFDSMPGASGDGRAESRWARHANPGFSWGASETPEWVKCTEKAQIGDVNTSSVAKNVEASLQPICAE